MHSTRAFSKKCLWAIFPGGFFKLKGMRAGELSNTNTLNTEAEDIFIITAVHGAATTHTVGEECDDHGRSEKKDRTRAGKSKSHLHNKLDQCSKTVNFNMTTKPCTEGSIKCLYIFEDKK